MRNLFGYWEAVLIVLMMLLMFAVLSVGAGVLVYVLMTSFSPAVLASCTGVLMFLALLFMFFKALSN